MCCAPADVVSSARVRLKDIAYTEMDVFQPRVTVSNGTDNEVVVAPYFYQGTGVEGVMVRKRNLAMDAVRNE